MNEMLKKALEFSNFKQSLSIQRKVLKEKLNARLTFGYEGGLFKIDQTLICFVKFLIDEGRTADVVIIDLNENPILIKDLGAFKTEILDRYFTAVNESHIEYEKIKKSRTVDALVDL
jgi:hypothetical protein